LTTGKRLNALFLQFGIYVDGREISLEEGRARIAAAAGELAAEGLDVAPLREVLARL
jgi:hypothetical protein